jgi:peptidyl-prolyl cis-trans isomerase A (cyclophilin A)
VRHALLLAALAAAAGCKKDAAPPPGPSAPADSWTGKAEAGKPLYAVMKTSQGDVTLKLWSDRTPKTVANFVGLASGEKDWKSPATGERKKAVKFYDGLTFHRVIDGFMIQGGCPLGTGTGDPGYSFEDECQKGCLFDKVGLLAMANAGPNTKHTIFGEVLRGYEVVEAISRAPRNPMDKPLQPITIVSITLSDTQP